MNNQFAKSLDSILHLRKEDFTAAQFAEAAGINPGDLSRSRKGDKAPTREFYTKIIACPLLAREEAQRLIIAHCRDFIPDEHTDSIQIRLQDLNGTAAESQDELTAALEYYRLRALTEPEFHAWFTGLYKSITGK